MSRVQTSGRRAARLRGYAGSVRSGVWLRGVLL